MGEKPFNCKFQVFLTGDPKPFVEVMQEDVPDRAVCPDCSEDEAPSFTSEWNEVRGEWSFTVKCVDDSMRVFIENMRRRDRYARKALLYAVTHGYNVQLFCRDKKGDDVMMVVLTPRLLRRLFRVCPVVPLFRVYDRNGKECRIRKGKVL
jgi:hypothetical protein